jgi:hypothetical protein
MLGFKSTATARVILGGIEMIHMMRKQQAKYAGIRSLHSRSKSICSPHERDVWYLLLSHPCSGFATKPTAVIVHAARHPRLYRLDAWVILAEPEPAAGSRAIRASHWCFDTATSQHAYAVQGVADDSRMDCRVVVEIRSTVSL